MNDAKYLLRMKLEEKKQLELKAKAERTSINKLIKKKLFGDKW